MAVAMLLTACGGEASVSTPEPTPAISETPEPKKEAEPEESPFSLAGVQWEKSSDGSYYQLLGVHFCTNLSAEQYQTMNIYVPSEYFDGG